GLTDLLHRRQQQAEQDPQDGDHHQQFQQREATAGGGGTARRGHVEKLSGANRDLAWGPRVKADSVNKLVQAWRRLRQPWPPEPTCATAVSAVAKPDQAFS